MTSRSLRERRRYSCGRGTTRETTREAGGTGHNGPFVRVLIFHGYLLRGTGSNVYSASLVTALARLGHEVHLLCQDHEPHDWPGPGSVEVHRPDIGGLLPVFVKDRYEGFEVKTFSELSEAELEEYIERNVRAI